MGVEAHLHLARGDPARERDERVGIQHERCLLLGLPHRRLRLGLALVDRAAGEDPRAPHEARLGISLNEKELEPALAIADRDHGARRARLGYVTVGVELLAGTGTVCAHGGTLLTFAAA